MRRGGPIFLVLGFLVLLVLGGLAFMLFGGGASLFNGGTGSESTAVPVVEVYVAGQHINKDQEITDDLLATIQMPQSYVTVKMVIDKQTLIGKYVTSDMEQGWPFSPDMLASRPGTGGSKVILPGQVAISIPVSRTNMVGFGIKNGDYVDVIATTMFVDLDASFQSELPNSFGQVVNLGSQPDAAPLAVLGMNNSGSGGRTAGRAELDPTLNQVIYFVPSEPQRPRIVSQMILQDIQVLHVGNFVGGDQAPSPDATQDGPAPTAVPSTGDPNIITLIVSPQDAVSLVYFEYSGVKFTLALRAPDDRSRAETEAATLQYILSQYAIPVPAKLPYGFEPAIRQLPDVEYLAVGTPTPK